MGIAEHKETPSSGRRRLARSVVIPAPSAAMLALACAALLTGFLLLFAYTGLYTRYATDDFGIAQETRDYGIWGSMLRSYFDWSGRFSFFLVFGVLAQVSRNTVWYIPALTLLVWVSGLSYLLRLWLPGKTALRLAVAAVTFTLILTPDIGQSLYWQASALGYLPPLALGAWSFGFILRQPGHVSAARDAGALAVCFLLPFAAAGFSEMVSLLQLAALAALLAGHWRRPAALLAGFCGAAAGVGVMAAAPGNLIRASHFPHHLSHLQMAALAWRYTQEMLMAFTQAGFFDIFDTWLWPAFPVFALTLLLAAALTVYGSVPAVSVRAGRAALLLAAIWSSVAAGIFLCYLAGVVGMSQRIPSRSEVVPTYVLVCGIAATGAMLGMWVRPFRAPVLRPYRNGLRWGLVLGTAWLLLNFAAFGFFSARANLRDMQNFAVQFDAQDAFLKSAARQQAAVTIPVLANPYGAMPLTDDPHNWVNVSEERYYRIPSLRALPPVSPLSSGQAPSGEPPSGPPPARR